MPKNIEPINQDFKGKDIVSLSQFSPKDIEILFRHTEKMADIGKNAKSSDLLKGNIVTLLFYEPSSRTFGSFCAASQRLGAGIIPIQDAKTSSSVVKGETLEDTIQTFQSFSNIIVMRHPEVGSALLAAQSADIPVINAGDGKGEHPTQTLLDLYTIYKHHKRLDNLTFVFGGDMLNGRTIHSLIAGLSLYKNNTIYLLSPKQLKLSKEYHALYAKLPIKLVEIQTEKKIPKNADVWYWTRVQKERFNNIHEYEKIKNSFIITPDLLRQHAGKNTIILHPLPRVGEIETTVDSDPRALYLRTQMRNGMYVRMALLALVLGKV